MTKLEYEKCKNLMEEAIINKKKARDKFTEANETTNETDKEVFELQAQNYLGYATGINQCLVTLGFKHERMSVLNSLI